MFAEKNLYGSFPSVELVVSTTRLFLPDQMYRNEVSLLLPKTLCHKKYGSVHTQHRFLIQKTHDNDDFFMQHRYVKRSFLMHKQQINVS